MDNPPVTGNSKFSLKTQGIFAEQPYEAETHRINDPRKFTNYHDEARVTGLPDGVKKIWGLTRSGAWIVATVCYRDEPGYKGRGYQRAVTVHIEQRKLEALIQETKVEPRAILRELSRAVGEWKVHRESLYNDIAAVNNIVHVEDVAVSMLN